MRIGSLFSGYGGLDMAVTSVLRADVAWHVEHEGAPSRILAHHYPDIPNHGDITAVDWSAVEPVDIITGGFPCQDISSSGLKAGIHGQRSGLWSHYARAISHLRPRLVVVENVSALIARGLGTVLGDLADLGYDAQWASLSACSVGAPFRRVRVFLVASPTGSDSWRSSQREEPDRVPLPRLKDGANEHDGPDADRLALGDRRALERWAAVTGRPWPSYCELGTKGQPRLTAQFSEWLMGLPDGWVTDPAIGIGRLDQLKALGNGVVPQQAALALDVLLQGASDDIRQGLATV